ncbi:MAG: sensor histidine kinase [Oscillospiraceae bacterium]
MKFRLKIMACMLCLMSVLFGAGGSALILISFQKSLEGEIATAENSYRMLLYTLQVAGGTDLFAGTENMRNALRQMTGQKGAYWDAVLLVSGDEVVYRQGEAAEEWLSTEEKVVEGENAEERLSTEGAMEMAKEQPSAAEETEEEWMSVEETGNCRVTFLRAGNGERYLRISGGFSIGAQTLSLDTVHDISELYENRARQQNAYRFIFLLTMLLCAGLAYSMALILTRPLTRLSRGAREIADGNFSFRSEIRSDDEIGRLSQDFDRMADRIEENVQMLEESVKAQERFVSSFTHELKTPMTSVIGYADLLRSQELSEEERCDAANYIFMEGKRLERLSLKLMEIYVAKEGNIRLSLQAPGAIAEDVAAHLRPIYRDRNISLETRCERGTCRLEPDLFRSLLVNLIDNAGKAIGEEGHGRAISEKGRGETIREEGHIFVAVHMTKDGCVLLVEDDGPGIPEEAKVHLTEAFYRVDKSRSRKQGGAGLGLTLCANIAELHGGALGFENREGGGTRVRVELRGGRDEKR